MLWLLCGDQGMRRRYVRYGKISSLLQRHGGRGKIALWKDGDHGRGCRGTREGRSGRRSGQVGRCRLRGRWVVVGWCDDDVCGLVVGRKLLGELVLVVYSLWLLHRRHLYRRTSWLIVMILLATKASMRNSFGMNR